MNVPALASVNATGVASAPAGSTASATGMSTPSDSRWARQPVDRIEPLDLGVPHAKSSEPFENAAEDGDVALGAAGRARWGRVAARPAAEFVEHRGIVAVAGNGVAERKRAEILQEVVELVEPGVTVRPHAVARGELFRRKGREPEEVVGAVHHHVDRKVVTGEHDEVRPLFISDREAIPFESAAERAVLRTDALWDVHQRAVRVE